jgi:methanogenic corrinoid protein MtbC1
LSTMSSLEALYQAVVDLDEPRVLELAHDAVSQAEATPLVILHTCEQALRMVGERYERGEYYLAALVMAGELFREVVGLVPAVYEPALHGNSQSRVLIGVAQNDIHDIGKNVFSVSLRGHGFEVLDLGVDVSKESFLEAVRQSRPSVVCLSGLVLAAVPSMKETVKLIRAHERELGYRPPIVIGGATVDGELCTYVGADSWSTDALEGVRICQELIRCGRSDQASRAKPLRAKSAAPSAPTN